jgi:hypothetical protein
MLARTKQRHAGGRKLPPLIEFRELGIVFTTGILIILLARFGDNYPRLSIRAVPLVIDAGVFAFCTSQYVRYRGCFSQFGMIVFGVLLIIGTVAALLSL